ncbi:hypothetical protein C8Q80DRAFT_1169092 [Daedaleopsis nitida]|nr:hypothetical protein C8Q80DRAFT_1169092 [Daedaleopsis nitida]
MSIELQQSTIPSLFTMARSKLHSAVSGGVKDSCSLHRWVLLKNSILRSHTPEPAPSQAEPNVQHVYRCDAEESRDDLEEDEDAFMFPDPHALGPRSADVGDSETQWLDSLLEDLVDDDEDVDAATSISVIPVDEDDEPLSPYCSPMSSSDDLLDSHDHDPLPYFDADDDVEDLPVPDAIEDTSDDESDALSTPYSQSMSSLSPTDPASVPLPPERRRLRGHPHVYVDTDDAYFYPFELDPPLPFHDDQDSLHSARVFRPSLYQEC